MEVGCRVENAFNHHRVTLSTGGASHEVSIAPKAGGFGSAANGGELLCLALATCYCNDLYREAAKRGIEVVATEVEAHAEFGGVGEPARRLSYRVLVEARASEQAIHELIRHTDTVAEIQNTLRRGIAVELESATAVTAA